MSIARQGTNYENSERQWQLREKEKKEKMYKAWRRRMFLLSGVVGVLGIINVKLWANLSELEGQKADGGAKNG